MHKLGHEDVGIMILYQETLNEQTVMKMYILKGNNNFSPFLNDLFIISQLIQNVNT